MVKGKIIKYAFLSLFLIVIFSGFVSSSSYNITFNYVQDRFIVKEIINNDNIKNITLYLPEDATGIYSNINYTKTANQVNITGKNIEISYNSSEGIKKSGKDIFFVKKVVFPENFNTSEINIILEAGIIVNPENIYPINNKIGTDGEHILIYWFSDQVKKEDSAALFVTLEDTKVKSNYLFIFMLLIILIILASAFFIGYKKLRGMNNKHVKNKENKNGKKSKEHDKQQKKYNEELSYLLDTEKKIITELKKADRNELWQKQIQLSTGFSKAKVSRLIRNLESRNLIKKIPFGNTNKIRLK